MAQITVRNPSNGDVRVVPDALRDRYADRGFEIGDAPAASQLRGAALDEALDNANLSKAGTADEKRARLAAHLAAPAE